MAYPRVIIGLGNPGPAYVRTRHNIGFIVLDALAQLHDATWRSVPAYEYTDILINGHQVRLIKPMTGMNNSGVVIPALKKDGIQADQLLVVHDELELPAGTLKLRSGGSHRGHNGLKSIIAQSGADCMRLRFGIGRPDSKGEVPDYVLSPFTEDQTPLIEQAISLISSLY